MSCRNLVTGLMQYVSYNEQVDKKTFDTVVDMLRHINYNNDVLSKIYEKSVPHGKRLLGLVCEQPDETRKETIERTFAGMEKFASRANYPAFGTKCVDFNLTSNVPCAYFFVGGNASYYPFDKSFLFSQAFATLTGNGTAVNFILNQFGNLGLPSENVEKLLAHTKIKNCRVLMCVDTLSQMEKLYPKIYDFLFANFTAICVNEIYDNFTEDAITATCGKKRLNLWKIEMIENSDKHFLKSFSKRSKKKAVAEVISIDTLKNIDNNLTIAIIQGENPLLLEKYDFREHPKAEKIVKRSVYTYIPYVYRGVRKEE